MARTLTESPFVPLALPYTHVLPQEAAVHPNGGAGGNLPGEWATCLGDSQPANDRATWAFTPYSPSSPRGTWEPSTVSEGAPLCWSPRGPPAASALPAGPVPGPVGHCPQARVLKNHVTLISV